MEHAQDWSASQAAWERAKHSLGGGVSTGMRASMKPHPIFFTGGDGPRLTDVDGNDYLDYVLGWGPVILGHGNTALAQAVSTQMTKGATYGSGHEFEYIVAEQVLKLIPGMERVLWSNTGTEADQVALRLARAHTGRTRFVKFTGNYHGWSDPMLLGYRPDAQGQVFSAGSLGQHPGSLNDVDIAPWGDLDSAAAYLRDPTRDIAAVFVEPVLCNSGVLSPPEGFLEGLRELCNETGTTLVFDEVITGFRIAPGGAVEKYGVLPDLVVLAKAIAGGLPLAAVAGKSEIIDLMTRGVAHAGTYNGNPVVLAAAAATLNELAQPGIYDDFERRGAALAQGFRDALNTHNVTGVVNQVGPVVQCSLGIEDGTSFASFLEADQELYDHLTVELLSRGVFALPGGRWYISTAHTDADIAQTVRAFDEALAATIAA